jgi:hypothetical protein
MGIFGGGGGGGGSSSGTQVQIAREAPEVESRKLALYDEAAKLAQKPITLPQYQVAAPTSLQQQAFQAAGTTGVGQPTVQSGISSIQAGLGSAFTGPNISQFFNPYQSYVTDEITRQAQLAQNQVAGQAVQAGAFGGGREGVQQAEVERARQANIGQAQQQGFTQALQAAQQQQGLQAQTGLQAGQALLGAGAQQQAMQQGDIQSMIQAGGIQQQLAQQALDAARQSQLQQAYEPYQRTEFLKGIMTNLPTTQSSITATTAPGTNPLSQAAGAGLGAYAAYNMAKKKEGGIIDIKKFQVGGEVFTEAEKNAYLLAPVVSSLLQGTKKPGRSNLSGFLSDVGAGIANVPATAIDIKKLEIAAGKKGTKQVKQLTDKEKDQFGFMGTDVVLGEYTNGILTGTPQATFKTSEAFKEIRGGLEKSQIKGADEALRSLETTIADLAKKGKGGNLPGIGVIEGNVFTGTEGKNLRAKLAAFANIRLKDRSGAAVTESEFNRFAEELAGGQTTRDETALLASLQNARAELEKEKVKLINQFDPRGAKAFIEQEGISFYEPPGFIKNKTAAAGIGQTQDGSLTIDGVKVKFAAGVPLYLNPKNGVWSRSKPVQIKKD